MRRRPALRRRNGLERGSTRWRGRQGSRPALSAGAVTPTPGSGSLNAASSALSLSTGPASRCAICRETGMPAAFARSRLMHLEDRRRCRVHERHGARASAAEMLTAIRRGEETPHAPAETLFEAFTEAAFRGHERLRKPGTLHVNRSYLHNPLLPHFSGSPIAAIDRQEARYWFARLRETPLLRAGPCRCRPSS